MKKLILKHALLNAAQHGGKANVQAVLGKVIAERPELKGKIKEIIPEIKKAVREVNALSIDEQKERLKRLRIKPRKKVKKEILPKLPRAVKGKVVTAFPPEPSKYPHIGHAKGALLNYLYAKKYKGKFYLRFEDTNPELAKKECYDAFLDGLKWLDIKWYKLDYVSDHIEEYYEATEKLIEEDKAYVCVCKQPDIKKNRRLMIECRCRKNSVEKNLELWKKMLTIFKAGKASVRLKIDMAHSNAAMRDPTIMRIMLHKHPRTGKKYRVWPTYDFGTALMDAWEGVTHRVRSKEFEIRKELQQHIQRALDYKPPHITEIGRLNLKGVPSSGRKIRKMIHAKQLMGWDDPRLTTLIALRRRGFVPEAIKDFLISTGVSKAEAVLTWDILESFNRKTIDPIANRYFGVLDPITLSIEGVPRIKAAIKTVKAPLHPDFPKRGSRRIPVGSKLYIEKSDLKKHKGKEVGLMSLYSVKLGRNGKAKKAKFVSKRIKLAAPKIHWVSEPNKRVRIVMSNGSVQKAIAEPAIKNVKAGQLIQLPRVGFCRVDKAGKEAGKEIRKEIVLYFTHK